MRLGHEIHDLELTQRQHCRRDGHSVSVSYLLSAKGLKQERHSSSSEGSLKNSLSVITCLSPVTNVVTNKHLNIGYVPTSLRDVKCLFVMSRCESAKFVAIVLL